MIRPLPRFLLASLAAGGAPACRLCAVTTPRHAAARADTGGSMRRMTLLAMVLGVAGCSLAAGAGHAQGAGPVVDVWPGVAPGSS